MIYLENNTDPQEISIPRSFGVIVPAKKAYLTQDDIVDSLDSDDPKKVLAAPQGKRLKGMIDQKPDANDVYTKTQTDTLLEGKQDKIDADHKLDYGLLENTPTIPDAVEANPTIPEGTTPADLEHLKVGNDYFNIPQNVPPAPEIFWAEYGVTTTAQIDAAIAAGKFVVCIFQGRQYPMGLPSSGNYITFGFIYGGSSYYLLLNRNTDQWMQGSNSLENTANRSQSVPTDRESTTKYPSVKAVFDSLGKWGVISQTQTWTGNNNTGYDYTMSDLVWGLIPQTSIDLFEDVGAIFNDTGADIVRQDPFGYDVTHKTGCFYLPGIGDISYKEMITIYECRWSVPQIPLGSVPSIRVFEATRARCGLVTYGYNWNSGFNLYMLAAYNTGSPMSVLCLSTKNEAYIGSARQMLLSTPRIKAIYPVLNLTNLTGTGSAHNTFYGAFGTCSSLKEVRFKSLKINLPFGDCPSISLASIVYMVENAANTAAITVTLHATAFARCQADTTSYTYNGQNYTGIIAYAAAKNITIASA